jgi:hypothetical protein
LIADIKIGRFKKSQKPVTLNYLKITYDSPTGPISAIIVPTNSAFTFVWNTNKIIKMWYDIICDIKRGHDLPQNNVNIQNITIKNYSKPETLEGY